MSSARASALQLALMLSAWNGQSGDGRVGVRDDRLEGSCEFLVDVGVCGFLELLQDRGDVFVETRKGHSYRDSTSRLGAKERPSLPR